MKEYIIIKCPPGIPKGVATIDGRKVFGQETEPLFPQRLPVSTIHTCGLVGPNDQPEFAQLNQGSYRSTYPLPQV